MKPKVNAATILKDIRSGMGDIPIMEKYGISPRLYSRILETLKRSGALSLTDLAGRLPTETTTPEGSSKRERKRHCLLYPISVHDANDPRNQGTLNDISEAGFKVAGLNVDVDEIGTYLIGANARALHSPVTVDAICRWVTTEEDTGDRLAGFEISNVLGDGQRDLDRLITELSVPDGT